MLSSLASAASLLAGDAWFPLMLADVAAAEDVVIQYPSDHDILIPAGGCETPCCPCNKKGVCLASLHAEMKQRRGFPAMIQVLYPRPYPALKFQDFVPDLVFAAFVATPSHRLLLSGRPASCDWFAGPTYNPVAVGQVTVNADSLNAFSDRLASLLRLANMSPAGSC